MKKDKTEITTHPNTQQTRLIRKEDKDRCEPRDKRDDDADPQTGMETNEKRDFEMLQLLQFLKV